MFGRSEQIWEKFPGPVIARDRREALYLVYFLSQVRSGRCHLPATEIIDLQRYRIIRNKGKVASLLRLPERERIFLFPIIKN